jgi:hypothetical protein
LQNKVTAQAEAFTDENSAKKVCMWDARPTCTPFLRNLSPRLSSYKIKNKRLRKIENPDPCSNLKISESQPTEVNHDR